IENARHVSLRIERARQMQQFANFVADKIARITSDNQRHVLLDAYADLVGDATFATHLLYRLRGASADSTAALTWLENQLALHGSDPEMATMSEHTRQANDGVTMGNIIRALKAIDDVDWTTWFESVSHVDFLLR